MALSSLFLAGKGSALTSFFSTAFLVVFLPFCLVVYSLMPRRGKKYFLLAADCAFFWLISGKLLVYLLLTALSMHYFGLWLDKIQSETKLLLAQTEKAERKVQLYLDAAFFAEPGLIGVRPNNNTATVWLRADDLAALIREHGNPAHIAKP